MTDVFLQEIITAFGIEAKDKLAGVGEPEEALRVPIEHLIKAIGDRHGLKIVLDGEAHLTEISSRPDFAVRVNGAVVGYLEVKAPNVSLDPSSFRAHNKDQWGRLKGLPNLIYTNGSEWRLFRGEDEPLLSSSLSGGDLYVAGASLSGGEDFEQLLVDFLRWNPVPIRNVSRLVKQVAPITRMVRTKVEEQLAIEHQNVERGESVVRQQFLGLANDWRRLLFPDASDAAFADGFAQTVTFALLLARSEGVDVGAASLYEVSQKLGDEHSLMGRALQLLTLDIKGDFVPTIELLRRVIGAVQWDAVRKNRDTYLHLYERFLDEYDKKLRKDTGTYYTPSEVVDQMVRLTEEVLATHLNLQGGFLEPSVVTIDPAMGTGTFLLSIIENVARKAAEAEGPGAVPGVVTELAKRLIGFELQLGSYAVAELRTTDVLRSMDANPPKGGMKLFVADTLSDPHSADTEISSSLAAISESKRQANKIKANVPVTVVIGNPPYDDRAEGRGGWVESGSKATSNDAKKSVGLTPLDAFRAEGNGGQEFNIKSMYIYFWRWATWKVFESVPSDRAGVVCLIAPGGYLRGPGYRGMREYLRRTADFGWVIDVTPEGIQPAVNTRIFPGVQQPLAIGIFARLADHVDKNPAVIQYRELRGLQADKFRQLAEMSIEQGWLPVRPEWQAPFTAASREWDEYPAVADLFPWFSTGVTGNRGWPFGPSEELLAARWNTLRPLRGTSKFAEWMKATGDRYESKKIASFAGDDTYKRPSGSEDDKSLSEDMETLAITEIGYRAFDRQFVIADARVLDRGRPDLWEARAAGAFFVVEQHSQPIHDGPALLFSGLIPDAHQFNNRGGRTLPSVHPDKSANVAPGLLVALEGVLGTGLTSDDLFAYVAAVTASPAFTERFENELDTPGVRVPITTDAGLWGEAVELGRRVIWLHSFGSQYTNSSDRPKGNVRAGLDTAELPLSLAAVRGLPVGIGYDASLSQIYFIADDGSKNGAWGPVSERVFNYSVGGISVVTAWFNQRKQDPGGNRTSPLDDIHDSGWHPSWTSELTNVLSVLTQIVALEDSQARLLSSIMHGDTVSLATLAARGVSWPSTKRDRKPRYSTPPKRRQRQPALWEE